MANPTFFEQVVAELESLGAQYATMPRYKVVADLIFGVRKIEAMDRTQDYTYARYPLIRIAAIAAWIAREVEQDNGR